MAAITIDVRIGVIVVSYPRMMRICRRRRMAGFAIGLRIIGSIQVTRRADSRGAPVRHRESAALRGGQRSMYEGSSAPHRCRVARRAAMRKELRIYSTGVRRIGRGAVFGGVA